MLFFANTADFIQLVNDWFDVQNSSLSTFNYPGKEPFGVALDKQKNLLLRINKIMSFPIVPNKKALEHFQKGIIMSNTALMLLLDYVNQEFNMSYICSKRLNQDILENFFWVPFAAKVA